MVFATGLLVEGQPVLCTSSLSALSSPETLWHRNVVLEENITQGEWQPAEESSVFTVETTSHSPWYNHSH